MNLKKASFPGTIWRCEDIKPRPNPRRLKCLSLVHFYNLCCFWCPWILFLNYSRPDLFTCTFVINIFYFFSHITQHSIQNITKQNKTKQHNRHILNISRFNQKGGREGRTIKTQKSLLYTITYSKQKTLPSINGRGPGPTNSRRCTFTWHYLQEATDPICFSTRVV